MFQKIAQLITRSIPQPLDNGVLYDALDPVRPHCVAQDLSATLHGGWVPVVLSATGDAGRHPLAFTVLDDGELLYDVLVINRLAEEFTNRGLSVSYNDLKCLLAQSSGSVGAATQMAIDCHKLELSRKVA